MVDRVFLPVEIENLPDKDPVFFGGVGRAAR